MKNKRGFTLVELMAVIVVLAIVISIAIPSAMSISRKVKVKMYDTKVKMLESSAKIYGQDNPDIVGSDDNCTNGGLITVQTLVDKGYIKKDDTEKGYVLNPIDNSNLNNETVCVYKKNNRIYAVFTKKKNANATGSGMASIAIKSYSGNSVTLTIGAKSQNSGISKYVLKYGTSSTSLSSSKTVNTTATSATTSLNVTPGGTYFFQVDVYNSDGNLIESSDIISKKFDVNYYYYLSSTSIGTTVVSAGLNSNCKGSGCIASMCAGYTYSTVYRTDTHYVYGQTANLYLIASGRWITYGGATSEYAKMNLNIGSRTCKALGSTSKIFTFEYAGMKFKTPIEDKTTKTYIYTCGQSINGSKTYYTFQNISLSAGANFKYSSSIWGVYGSVFSWKKSMTNIYLLSTKTSMVPNSVVSNCMGYACQKSGCTGYDYTTVYRTDTLYTGPSSYDKNVSVSGRSYFSTSYIY